MYSGWTPSEQLKARMAESLLQDNFRHILLTLTTEAEADDLHALVNVCNTDAQHQSGEMSDIDRWGENEALYRDMIGGN